MKRLVSAAVAVATALALAIVPTVGAFATPTLAAPAPVPVYTIGSVELATPAGGNYLYVATNGDDIKNDGSTEREPLRNIQTAIRAAGPGDVIVVRGGTYSEALGYLAPAGTSAKPIVLQNYPGEKAIVQGYLNIKNPSYWTIDGMRFTYGKPTGSAQSIVSLYGGTGWSFVRNEVWGTRGVANLLVTTLPGQSVSAKSAPHAFDISSNCIHDQNGRDASGTDHNIYLMASIYSKGGTVSHNLLAGATNGGGIKASGPGDVNLAPVNVAISYNTILGSASGVIIGQKAQRINITKNVIAMPSGSGAGDGGVKTYAMWYPTKNSISSNVIGGYKNPIRETGDVRIYVPASETIPWEGPGYTGSIANCSVVLDDPNVAARFGHQGDPANSLTSDVTRLSGASRYDTAIAISKQFKPGVSRLYLATGESYADALSAGPAAGFADSPLLLTPASGLTSALKAEIDRLDPSEIVIVGGAAVVSEAVAKAVTPYTSKVTRLAGKDRYETSRLIAKYAFSATGADNAYIANGTNFPDALAAGPASAVLGGPVVLVNGTSGDLDPAVTKLLDSLKVTTVRIAGGTGAVSAGIERGLRAEYGTVKRLAGADRYSTAIEINRDAFTGTTTNAFLATGTGFADALAGSALAGAMGAPLYTSKPTCVPAGAMTLINRKQTEQVYLLGGGGALGPGVASLISCAS